MLFCTVDMHLNSLFFFFNDTATTEIYTLSLHDALPIWEGAGRGLQVLAPGLHNCAKDRARTAPGRPERTDRKSTRLNSSHTVISYAVFCLKKKRNQPGRLQPLPKLPEDQSPP